MSAPSPETDDDASLTTPELAPGISPAAAGEYVEALAAHMLGPDAAQLDRARAVGAGLALHGTSLNELASLHHGTLAGALDDARGSLLPVRRAGEVLGAALEGYGRPGGDGRLLDAETGLAGRPLLLDRLRHLIALGRRHGTGDVTLLLVDVDGLGAADDPDAPAAVGAVASTLLSLMREVDTVARIAERRFAVLLAGADAAAAARAAAARVVTTFARRPPENLPERARVRVGVSPCDERVDPADQLLDAEEAMTREAEGETIGVRDLSADRRVTTALARADELHRALIDGAVDATLSPVVSLVDGSTAGVRVAPRWRLGDELLGPEAVVSRAMAAGMLSDLHLRVLHLAAIELIDGPERPTVYLNACHPRYDAQALAGAISATRSAGFDLDVVVELEGATIFDGPDGARTAVEPLLAIGAGVAVAGFGAGRSPLTRLRELPVRALVIDPSIVSDGYFEIIEPLAEVGRHLGVAVIATGVDTPEALERVRESGCPFAEGAALGGVLTGVGDPRADAPGA